MAAGAVCRCGIDVHARVVPHSLPRYLDLAARLLHGNASTFLGLHEPTPS